MVEAVDRAQGRRLAGAVRADQGHDLAVADAQRDALERVDRAVVACGRRRARARTPPSALIRRRLARGRPRSRARCACTSAGVPSAIFSPYSSTVQRSETPITTFMSCSIRSTVRPLSSRTRRTNAVKSRRLLRVHPGGGLVEQQQLRVGGERPRDLEPALVAVGERPALVLVRAAAGRCRRAARAPARGRAASSRRTLGVRRIEPRDAAVRGGSACRRGRSRARSSARRAGCSGTCGRSRAR